MTKIYTTELICDHDPDDFEKALNTSVAQFQSLNLLVKVQFSSSTRNYAALVIAYRA